MLSTHCLSYLRICYRSYRKNANVLLKGILFGYLVNKWSEYKVDFATKWLLESQKTMVKPHRGGLGLNSFFFFMFFAVCFLVAVIHTSHRAYNILIETHLQYESFLYLLRSCVQTLWMLTDFASLSVMQMDIDHQLSNPWIFHGCHNWSSKQ